MNGNGDPIPDSPRGIPLLGDRDGENFIPAGMKTGKIYPPSGLEGTGMFHRAPSLIPAGPDYKLPNCKLLAFQFGLEGGEPAHEGSKAHYDLA